MNNAELGQILEIIEILAKCGRDDARMLMKFRALEKSYDGVLGTLSPAQQDIICDYVSECEAMSYRKLELTCQYFQK